MLVRCVSVYAYACLSYCLSDSQTFTDGIHDVREGLVTGIVMADIICG